ncbi:MAG: trehalase family glycosidase [Nitritalea sp.]
MPHKPIHFPESFPGLFEEVQTSSLFADSKTFVDLIPQADAEVVMAAYTQACQAPDWDLAAFVTTFFHPEPVLEPALLKEQEQEKKPQAEEGAGGRVAETPDALLSSGAEAKQVHSLETHLHAHWKVLRRAADEHRPPSSLLPLPYAYVVPGGRFGEIYYWDSYFTMLGLAESGENDLLEAMLRNFASLIDTIGFIPNGNRSYFLSRSQPPFFALMLELAVEKLGRQALYTEFYTQLEREWAFWEAHRRVDLSEGQYLFRYDDAAHSPRPESFREDVHLAREVADPQALYRHLRAACESGWDFSSRWLADPQQLSSIRTAALCPVDLNSLLYQHARIAATAAGLSGREVEQRIWRERQEQLRSAVLHYCRDAETGVFLDYDVEQGRCTEVPSAAMAFPIWAGLAEGHITSASLDFLERELLKPGGIVCTPVYSGQQWDAPNGWAPLQWIAYQAFQLSGRQAQARLLAERWCSLNEAVFQRTGKMMEKYHVEDLSLEAGGGEYPVQDGFGWTNGVYLALRAALRKEA